MAFVRRLLYVVLLGILAWSGPSKALSALRSRFRSKTTVRKSIIALTVSALLCVCTRAQQYFPAGTLSSDQKMEEFSSDWYSQELESLHEPVLYPHSKHPDELVYRFLWLRSFHPPLCARLDIYNGFALLTFKEGKFHDVVQPGGLSRARTIRISRDRAGTFLKKVADAAFWNMPSPNGELGGPDGSEWILEGVTPVAYKVVTVYTPANNNPVRKLGLALLLDIAHAQVPSNAIY